MHVYVGKTTALRIALGLLGAMENVNSHKISSSSLLLQTAMGTLPIGKYNYTVPT